jgi:hypothetical protein
MSSAVSSHPRFLVSNTLGMAGSTAMVEVGTGAAVRDLQILVARSFPEKLNARERSAKAGTEKVERRDPAVANRRRRRFLAYPVLMAVEEGLEEHYRTSCVCHQCC